MFWGIDAFWLPLQSQFVSTTAFDTAGLSVGHFVVDNFYRLCKAKAKTEHSIIELYMYIYYYYILLIYRYIIYSLGGFMCIQMFLWRTPVNVWSKPSVYTWTCHHSKNNSSVAENSSNKDWIDWLGSWSD